MNESEETLEQMSDRELLIAIAKRVGNIEKRLDNHDAQFEAIREGIVHNNSKFDRLEAVVYGVRGDISNLRADLRDLSEEVRQNRKTLV